MANILIIDDDPVTITMLAEILVASGHLTLQATDGRKGVELLKQNPIDIVILDIYMPVQDGIETIIEITKGKNIPKIIAMTAGSDKGGRLAPTLEIAKELGAAKVMLKPIAAGDLLSAVHDLLSGP